MEDSRRLVMEDNSHSRTLAFFDVSSQSSQKRLDVVPADIAAGRTGKDCFQSPVVASFHSLYGAI